MNENLHSVEMGNGHLEHYGKILGAIAGPKDIAVEVHTLSPKQILDTWGNCD